MNCTIKRLDGSLQLVQGTADGSNLTASGVDVQHTVGLGFVDDSHGLGEQLLCQCEVAGSNGSIELLHSVLHAGADRIVTLVSDTVGLNTFFLRFNVSHNKYLLLNFLRILP